MNLWLFFQNQVLGMQWLNTLVGSLLTALGVDTAGAHRHGWRSPRFRDGRGPRPQIGRAHV